jgi:hypothetical protein
MSEKVWDIIYFYKWVHTSEDIDCCYVGNTVDMVCRKRDHKNACNNPNSKKYNQKIYETIRQRGGFANWKMIEIGCRENITKRDAVKIEEEYRVALKADLNTRKCYSSPEEKKKYNKQYEANRGYRHRDRREYYKRRCNLKKTQSIEEEI